jgi:hypothetical protein
MTKSPALDAVRCADSNDNSVNNSANINKTKVHPTPTSIPTMMIIGVRKHEETKNKASNNYAIETDPPSPNSPRPQATKRARTQRSRSNPPEEEERRRYNDAERQDIDRS